MSTHSDSIATVDPEIAKVSIRNCIASKPPLK